MFDGNWYLLFGNPVFGVPKEITIVLSNSEKFVKREFRRQFTVQHANNRPAMWQLAVSMRKVIDWR